MKSRKLKAVLATFMIATMFVGCTNNSNKKEDNKTEVVTVKDERGEVKIPKNPQNIVDLSGKSDVLTALGLKVTGTANSADDDNTKLPEYLKDTLSGAKVLGNSMQKSIDLEAVKNLKPDVIIISTVQESMYDSLSKIAPTVMIALDQDWKNDFRKLGQVFNKRDAANEWLSKYETKAKEAGEKIKAKYGADKTYLSFLINDARFEVLETSGLGDVLYNDMGLSKPNGMPKQENSLNYEQLASIKADYMFAIASDEDLDKVETNSVWNSIPAVKEKTLIKLTKSQYSNQANSCIGREKLVEQISELLEGKK